MKKNPDHTVQKAPIVFPYGGAKVGKNSEKKLWNLERKRPRNTSRRMEQDIGRIGKRKTATKDAISNDDTKVFITGRECI
jgi:hypothetical protein